MGRPALAILSFSVIDVDPRVRRQVAALNDEFEITTIGFGSPSALPCRHVPLPSSVRRGFWRRSVAAFQLLLQRHEGKYWSHPLVRAATQALEGSVFDTVLANDIDTLPVALAVPGACVVFDAHEYKPREFEDRRRFAAFQRYYWYLWRTYVPRAHAIITVSEGLARQLALDAGVDAVVVTNAAPFTDLQPKPSAPDGVIRLVHHGYAIPSRRLENMIDVMGLLDDRFSLDFHLLESERGYLDHLRGRAAGDARIRFRAPLPAGDVIRATNDYDVGFFLLEPTNFNYLHALPNKLFEFVQARLAVAIGPSPDMADLVRRHALGVVAPAFTPAAMAETLRALTPSAIDAIKERVHAAAGILHSEAEEEKLRSVVRQARSVSRA